MTYVLLPVSTAPESEISGILRLRLFLFLFWRVRLFLFVFFFLFLEDAFLDGLGELSDIDGPVVILIGQLDRFLPLILRNTQVVQGFLQLSPVENAITVLVKLAENRMNLIFRGRTRREAIPAHAR